jgi:hypothetical protein
VIGTDCIGSCKSNYHSITTTTAPISRLYTLYWRLHNTRRGKRWYIVTATNHDERLPQTTMNVYQKPWWTFTRLVCTTPLLQYISVYLSVYYEVVSTACTIGVLGENHRPVASNWQTLSHNVVLSTPRHERFWNHNVSGDRHWIHDLILSSSCFQIFF